MSAPTALDGGALEDGLAWRVPVQGRSGGSLGERADGPERRTLDRLALLTREHNDLCTQAADRSEIAAGLEAAGINDRTARQVYGVASVFELADLIYQRVPRRPVSQDSDRDPWRHPVRRHLIRGLLYALPGLLYYMALRSLHAGAGVVLLVAATVIGTALGQGLSLLGHLLLGRRQTRAAGTLFRVALGVGVGLLDLLTALGLGLDLGFNARVALLAGAQIVYLLAATTLIVVDADLLLLALLAPAAALSGLTVLGLLPLATPAVISLLTVSPLATVAAAGTRFLGRRSGATGPGLTAALGRAELRMGLAYCTYGALNAALLSFAVLDVLIFPAESDQVDVAIAMAPLVLTLGVADWLVHRLRSQGLHLLQRSATLTQFRRGAGRMLSRSILGYAAVLGVGCGLAWYAGVRWTGGVETTLLLDIAGYSVLGLALLLIALMLSLGRHRLVLVCTAGAVALDLLARLAPWATEGGPALAATHLAVFALLLLTLLPVTRLQFASVIRHR